MGSVLLIGCSLIYSLSVNMLSMFPGKRNSLPQCYVWAVQATSWDCFYRRNNVPQVCGRPWVRNGLAIRMKQELKPAG